MLLGATLAAFANEAYQMMRTRRSLMEQPSQPQSPLSDEEHEADPGSHNRHTETQVNTTANATHDTP